MRQPKKAYRITLSGKPVGGLLFFETAKNRKARMRHCFKNIGIIKAV